MVAPPESDVSGGGGTNIYFWKTVFVSDEGGVFRGGFSLIGDDILKTYPCFWLYLRKLFRLDPGWWGEHFPSQNLWENAWLLVTSVYRLPSRQVSPFFPGAIEESQGNGRV